jgi:hypothetical protein
MSKQNQNEDTAIIIQPRLQQQATVEIDTLHLEWQQTARIRYEQKAMPRQFQQ